MKQEKGFSLIEVVLAIALLGVVAVAFLGALATGSKTIFIADERATAESLARAQMEYVRNQDYDAENNPPQYALIPDIPAGYDIAGYDGSDYDISVFEAQRMDRGDGTDTDTGIQIITVVVYHPYDSGDPYDWVVKLEGYRSWR
jgi:prepilin-type N-terminal cleavage/methylation domain-containing protein